MTEAARKLLSILARLPGGASQADLARLVPGEAEAAGRLTTLGLIHVDEFSRRSAHPFIREYVSTALPLQPEELSRVIAHYGGLAALFGPRVGGTKGAEALELLRVELENIEAMLLEGLQRAEVQVVIDQILDLNNFWRFSGYGSSHVVAKARTVAQKRGDRLREALCLQVEGQILLERSSHREAEALFRKALPVFKQADPELSEKRSTLGYARCIRGIGSIALDGQRLDEAESSFQQALHLFEKVGSPLSEGNCIHCLGKVGLERGLLQEARLKFVEAKHLFERLEDRLGRAYCLRNLGELDASPALLEEARTLFSEVGNLRGQAHSIRCLGNLALKRSALDDAQALYEQARPLLKRVGSLRGEANCLMGLGNVALQRSQPEIARVHFEEASQLFERVEDKRSLAQCERHLETLRS
ncbi:tetratricopeptide repeat protein [Hyalangium sp.]|uniref:tetratricopeptide repeat protein n=1 Tax=Hyalangium sp. TaxID=2028555 RepID=UPI00389A1C13